MSVRSNRHELIKLALTERLRLVAALAEEVGLGTLARDLTETRIPKLEAERFSLVVVGEFNHGKSTFVNALVGAPILPTGITPTTATINHLVYADAPRATAFVDDGSQRDIDPRALGNWVTIEGAEVGHVRLVEIGWPAEILRDGVTLVDTPGVNDLNEQRAEVTYGYIPRADAALFLLDGTQLLKQSERAFLEQRILRRSRDKLIFIVGKIDLLARDELEEALHYCRQNLARIVVEPLIFPVSAKRELSSNEVDRKQSGFVALREHLALYLASDRGRVLLDNAISDGLRTTGYLRQNLGIKRRSLELSVDELQTRVAKVKEQLESSHATLRKTHTKIVAESAAIAATLRLDLEQFAATFSSRMGGEIDRVSGDEVKLYLAAFLQDTWKAWAEEEGEKLALLLERLAEEVIAVTNENVDEVVSTLQRELGPADAKIEIDVDTLKYDVGVFAIGALGTGLFLFVNTLVGGLLTLAAPLIAVLMKERISGQIKTQAKQAAPQAIEKVAHAIAPRFLQVVADFENRLADFVTAAGTALHQGIAEVLDRALTDRRAAGVDVAVAQSEIGAQLERLLSIERELEKQREALWGSSTESTNSLLN